jgi:hypothetical protein
MTEEITTGVDVLRKTVHARNKSPHALRLIADEVPGVGAGTLEDFSRGKADLGIEALQALTKVLYPHAEYDVESGMLRSANKAEPQAMPDTATYPPPYSPKTPEQKVFWRAMREMEAIKQPCAAPQPMKPEPPQPKRGRPGWIGRW